VTVNVLVATDAEWIVESITAALGDEETYFTVVSEGRVVADVVKRRAKESKADYDLAILDLQIGTMGGIAVTMSLRLDESAGALPHVPVLVLLDRMADVHLARRSGADGWLVKPLDPLRLGRAARAVLAGKPYHNGSVPDVVDAEPVAEQLDEPAGAEA
jgi:DNA-binding response OmpR family regulator